jgi:hypothetical protein
MDAFLYACAKIIVFNKRAQQFEKYTMYYLLFHVKAGKSLSFLLEIHLWSLKKAYLKSLDL